MGMVGEMPFYVENWQRFAIIGCYQQVLSLSIGFLGNVINNFNRVFHKKIRKSPLCRRRLWKTSGTGGKAVSKKDYKPITCREQNHYNILQNIDKDPDCV